MASPPPQRSRIGTPANTLHLATDVDVHCVADSFVHILGVLREGCMEVHVGEAATLGR
jgi:hypothetical protein